MDQQKIGTFLKELRKEKGMTQEQLAEEMNVSRRTVSRWETGFNMPDLDILVDLSQFYDVDLREILDGERKDRQMNEETKDTVLKVAEYESTERAKIMKRMNLMFICALAFMVFYLATMFMDVESSPLMDFLQGLSLGIGFGMLIIGVIITSSKAKQIRDFKLRLLGKLPKES